MRNCGSSPGDFREPVLDCLRTSFDRNRFRWGRNTVGRSNHALFSDKFLIHHLAHRLFAMRGHQGQQALDGQPRRDDVNQDRPVRHASNPFEEEPCGAQRFLSALLRTDRNVCAPLILIAHAFDVLSGLRVDLHPVSRIDKGGNLDLDAAVHRRRLGNVSRRVAAHRGFRIGNR